MNETYKIKMLLLLLWHYEIINYLYTYFKL